MLSSPAALGSALERRIQADRWVTEPVRVARAIQRNTVPQASRDSA